MMLTRPADDGPCACGDWSAIERNLSSYLFLFSRVLVPHFFDEFIDYVNLFVGCTLPDVEWHPYSSIHCENS